MLLYFDELSHVQGEIDVDGGQPGGGLVVVGIEVVVGEGRLVDVNAVVLLVGATVLEDVVGGRLVVVGGSFVDGRAVDVVLVGVATVLDEDDSGRLLVVSCIF